MSSNLEYVVSTLNTGDLVSAAFVDAKGEWYTVEGKVTVENTVDYPAVKIGKVALATVGLFGLKTDKPKPVASLKQIVVISRAPKPYYSNRPVERKPQAGDVFYLAGYDWYYDGISVFAVGSSRKPMGIHEIAGQFVNQPKLISEKAAA